ncbi:MAG: hypothetical protein HZB50_09455 [Chloroflexi bacterium]|nr:hypothetical protein [Chloroflexota bacterium]
MPSRTSPQQRSLVFGLIFIGILFTAFFGMRAFHAFRKFNGHRPPPPNKFETDVELIRDWMTVPFISRMYQVSPEIIFEALSISPQKDHNKSLKELNDEYYPNKNGYVLELVKQTVSANLPPPTPGSAPTESLPPTAPAP